MAGGEGLIAERLAAGAERNAVVGMGPGTIADRKAGVAACLGVQADGDAPVVR